MQGFPFALVAVLAFNTGIAARNDTLAVSRVHADLLRAM